MANRISTPFSKVLLSVLCGASVAAYAQSPNSAAQTSVAWESLHVSTGCEAMRPEMCAGAYGFTVRADGHYVVGPNTAGKTLEGELSAQELASLQSDAQALLKNTIKQSRPECPRRLHFIPGVWRDSRLQLKAAHEFQISSRIGLCQYAGDAEASKKLDENLYALVVKYYPRPF